MRNLFAAFFAMAVCLSAADFWAKPSAEWSDKDLQKMLTNSPWARSFNPPNPGGGLGDSGAPPPLSEGRGGRGGGGGGGAAPGGGGPPGVGGPVPTIYARWQSALPVKQAFVRLKFGDQAATSPDAKKLLEREEPDYEIVVSGPLRSLLRGDSETLKKTIMDASSLSAKGKDVKPSDVRIALNQASNDMVFLFPRTTPFTVDDKEVEFLTKFGELTVKFKFKLKDMVFNGKLEM